jgi:hypothetical protein
MNRCKALFLSLVALAVLPRSASGWGTPHPEITRHALRMLPASDRLDARLGGVRQMEDLAWGGDYQGEIHARYYVDDYLLFPGFPRHSSHLMPHVAETWKPFFLRTLQALRGESPQNAARWLGSFLHFVEDSGSPPHALPTTGVLHTRMENYLFTYDVRLSGYRPRPFRRPEAEALEDLAQRMEGLVAFSRERAVKLLPLAERDDRPACEPLELECAQETMRVVADVTHSLMALSEDGPRPGSASIRGTIRAPAMAEFPLAPAKVILEGTAYSTVADAGPGLPGDREYQAGLVLGGLPPGEYSVLFMRTGCVTARRKVRLGKGKAAALSIRLQGDTAAGNLVRNPDFTVRWLRPGQPDHWTQVGDEWRSDAFRVTAGGSYLFGARDAKGTRGVALRIADDPRMPASARRLELSGETPVEMSTTYAQLVVKGEAEPVYAFARPVRR